MQIRTLTAGDAEAFWNLRLAALESAPDAFGESAEEHRKITIEAFAERLRGGNAESFVLGAFDESRLMGTVGFYRDLRLKRRHRGWIWGMFVAADCRGRGAGRALLETAVERARSIEGLRIVLLTVSASQTAARRLYRRLGFQVFGTEPGALQVGGRFLDEDHMVLDLSVHE